MNDTKKSQIRGILVRLRTVSYLTLLPYLVGKLAYINGIITSSFNNTWIEYIAYGYFLIFGFITFFVGLHYVILLVLASIIFYIFTGKYLMENYEFNDITERWLEKITIKILKHFK
jgi:hypothetical protein